MEISALSLSLVLCPARTYHMKEEDFPPLGGRRVNRAEIVAGGTGSFANVIASNLGRYVSL